MMLLQAVDVASSMTLSTRLALHHLEHTGNLHYTVHITGCAACATSARPAFEVGPSRAQGGSIIGAEWVLVGRITRLTCYCLRVRHEVQLQCAVHRVGYGQV